MNIIHINKLCKNTLISHLKIKIIEAKKDKLKGTMPVGKNTLNPRGVLHGGATLALIETLGSGLSYYTSDMEKTNVFGIEVNTNHVRSVTKGKVYGIAEFLHKGRSTHVVEVKVFSDEDKLISVGRVTNMIIQK